MTLHYLVNVQKGYDAADSFFADLTLDLEFFGV